MSTTRLANNLYQITYPNSGNNSYILVKDKKCVIIDPSFNFDEINKVIHNEHLSPKGIIITHGHFDHFSDGFELMKKYKVNMHVFETDRDVIENHSYHNFFTRDFMLDPKTITYFNDSELAIDSFKFKITNLHGHTVGSIIIDYENYLFVGDIIFADGIGRYDLFSGSYRDLVDSVKYIIKNYCNDKVILTGHGEITAIGELKKENDYVKLFLKDNLNCRK